MFQTIKKANERLSMCSRWHRKCKKKNLNLIYIMADVEIHCGTLIEDYILWNKKNELEEIAKETFQIKYRGENTREQARVSVYCEISSMIFYIYIYIHI